MPTVGTREPMLQPSKGGITINAANSTSPIDILLVPLGRMSASSPFTGPLTMGSAFETSVSVQRHNWYPAPDYYWNPLPPESPKRNIQRSFSSRQSQPIHPGSG